MRQHRAAMIGNIKWFKTHTYDIYLKDKFGLNAFMYAVDYGHIDLVKYLIIHGTRVEHTHINWPMVLIRKVVSKWNVRSPQDIVCENRKNMALVLKKWIETPRSLKFLTQSLIVKAPKLLLHRNAFDKETIIHV